LRLPSSRAHDHERGSGRTRPGENDKDAHQDIRNHMIYDDHVARELAHIRAMILQLGQLISDNNTARPKAVMSPDYWRARLNAVLAGGIPNFLRPQVLVLLDRLDALSAASRSHTRGSRD
jgi:hypothetical protein